MEKTYKFENATVTVRGEINRERLEKATIALVKAARKQKENKK
jgi:hypothetical protein